MRVVLLNCDATTVSPSKFCDVETCSCEGDAVYLLSCLIPAFQTVLWLPPTAGVRKEAYSLSAFRIQTSLTFQPFFFLHQKHKIGHDISWNKESESIGIVYVGVVRRDPTAVLSKSVVDVREL